MPDTWPAHRHTGVHQRQARGAHRRHRGGTVRRHDLGDEAQRVREVLLVRDDRQDCTGGERTVADLAALGRADTAGLTVGPRRHVVVVQVALGVVRRERVDHLVHAGHGHGHHAHHLGLATLEQRRAVSGRQDADLGGDRAQIGDAAAVDADALVDDARAHQLLVERADGLLDHAVLPGELARRVLGAAQLGEDLGRDGVGRFVALGLVGDGDDRRELVAAGLLDGGEDLRRVVEDRRPLHRRDRALGGDHRGHELALQRDRFLDPHLAGLEAVGEDFLGDLRGAVLVVVERASRCRRPRPSSWRRRRCRAHGRRRPARRCRPRPLRRWGAGSTRRRRCRPCGRRRSGPRTGCPRSSAQPRRR